MREDNVYKVTLWVQNYLGIIICNFRAVQSKTEGMATSVRVFLEHPSYYAMTRIGARQDVRVTKIMYGAEC